MRSDRADEAELLECAHSIVQADLLGDLAIFDPQHGRSRKAHRAAGRRRQRSDEEVAEGRPRMRAATFPATHHVVALGDEVRDAPEIEVWKRLAKPGHEGL